MVTIKLKTMLKMKKALLPIVLLLSLFTLGCSEGPKAPENEEAAPSFTLDTLAGGKLRFPDDLQGKVVAIRFWADWCPFCESEMTLLEPVYQEYREKGLVILAINVRQDLKTVESFIGKLDISYDTLLDFEGDVARQYGVIGLPTTFFVDRKGVLKSRILGESTPEIFVEMITDLF